ncbi:MAG TPA: pantoate--beta-alanine ligase [Deltaproteobacteria bacterium]|jgi:pantoate--beta-alanine ligase|nr:pantoate--beta-alanine ligase [Deltaproteobacteria bacterium]
MKIIRTVPEMQRTSDELRKDKRIAFVPTMGYLHEGHLALVRKARELADVVIVSIFVNPIQFGPKEDLSRYPRDFDRDADLLGKEKTDIIFYPDDGEMYTEGFTTYVEVRKLEDHLCGKSRIGHFTGVATVVAKLFNIVKPHYAIFGQKDYQQLMVIERMVKDLNMDVEIVPYPTVREADGMAMSSRNSYLSETERKKARLISASLRRAQELIKEGERKTETIRKAVDDILHQEEGIEVEYIDICDTGTLEDVPVVAGRAVLAIACRIGKTRLIDNTILTEA